MIEIDTNSAATHPFTIQETFSQHYVEAIKENDAFPSVGEFPDIRLITQALGK